MNVAGHTHIFIWGVTCEWRREKDGLEAERMKILAAMLQITEFGRNQEKK